MSLRQNNREIEELALGCLLLAWFEDARIQCWMIDQLDPSLFSNPDLAFLFKVLRNLRRSGQAGDPSTVCRTTAWPRLSMELLNKCTRLVQKEAYLSKEHPPLNRIWDRCLREMGGIQFFKEPKDL